MTGAAAVAGRVQAAWDTLPAPAFARVVAHVLPQWPTTYEPAGSGSLLPSAAELAARVGVVGYRRHV